MSKRGLATGVAAVALFVACGGGDEAKAVVGVWPAAVEREFVEQSVESGFLDRVNAQCVLELLQQELTLDQFQRGLDDATAVEGFGEAYTRSIERCTLLRSQEPGT